MTAPETQPDAGLAADEVEALRPDRSPTWNTIFATLRDYRMSNVRDDIGGAFPLVDLMSNDGCSIATGEEEMAMLADEISIALTVTTAKLTSETERAEKAERERDEAIGTLRYCEGQWSDERGTMIDKFVYERGRANIAAATIADLTRKLEAVAGALGAAKALCDNINEFGHVTDQVFYDGAEHAVREAHAALLGKEKG